ncbi:MAG: hypothetical protein M1812_004210 [Candelaria pacifica]|nr:MAG: hypothetical protein M1812_004210 [Candelaria pacifica]
MQSATVVAAPSTHPALCTRPHALRTTKASRPQSMVEVDVQDLSRRLETHLLKEQVERRNRRASAHLQTTVDDQPKLHSRKQRLSMHGPPKYDAPVQELPDLPKHEAPKQDLPLRDPFKQQYHHTPQFAAADFERTTTPKTPSPYTARRLSVMPDADTARRLSYVPDSYTTRRSLVMPDPLNVRRSSAMPDPLTVRRSSATPESPTARRPSKSFLTQPHNGIESGGLPSPNQVVDAYTAARAEVENAAEYSEPQRRKASVDAAALEQQRYSPKSPKLNHEVSDSHPLVARQVRPKSTGDVNRDLDRIIASGHDVAFRLKPSDRHDWTQSDEGHDKQNMKERVGSIAKNWSSRRSSRQLEPTIEKETTATSGGKSRRKSSIFGLFTKGRPSSWT